MQYDHPWIYEGLVEVRSAIARVHNVMHSTTTVGTGPPKIGQGLLAFGHSWVAIMQYEG